MGRRSGSAAREGRPPATGSAARAARICVRTCAPQRPGETISGACGRPAGLAVWPRACFSARRQAGRRENTLPCGINRRAGAIPCGARREGWRARGARVREVLEGKGRTYARGTGAAAAARRACPAGRRVSPAAPSPTTSHRRQGIAPLGLAARTLTPNTLRPAPGSRCHCGRSTLRADC